MRFTKNWNNKLHCSYFTTIRKYTTDKYAFYKSQINKEIDVFVGDAVYTKAMLIDIDIAYLNNINKMMKIIDTGTLRYKDVFSNFGLSETDEVLILLYKTI